MIGVENNNNYPRLL